MKEIIIGASLEAKQKVEKKHSAAQVGSGALDVFSTPSMIALMEKTAMECVATFLDDVESTVGGAVNIKHYRPTAMGKEVVCNSVITNVKGKKVDFNVEVYEGDQLIGDGSHTRFIVDIELFMKSL